MVTLLLIQLQSYEKVESNTKQISFIFIAEK